MSFKIGEKYALYDKKEKEYYEIFEVIRRDGELVFYHLDDEAIYDLNFSRSSKLVILK